MPEFIQRRATAKDAPQIAALIRAAMISYKKCSGIKGNVLESLSESIDSVINRIENSNCICIFMGDKLVGTITVTLCDNPMKYSFSSESAHFLSEFDSCAYISRFAVSEDCRYMGLGTMLIDAAFDSEESVSSGITILHTALDNTAMKNFYYHRGFTLIDSEDSRGYERGLFARITN